MVERGTIRERVMRRWMVLACLALPLAGCAYDDYGYGYGHRYGPPVAYGGFYDNYYGPIYDGYWGEGDAFFYRTGRRGAWVRDTGGHFRRNAGPGPGFHEFRGQGPGARIGGPRGFRGGGRRR